MSIYFTVARKEILQSKVSSTRNRSTRRFAGLNMEVKSWPSFNLRNTDRRGTVQTKFTPVLKSHKKIPYT